MSAPQQGKPVHPNTELAPGDQVFIEWYGTWYPGEVLALERDGTVSIHYSGWDDSFDEVVPRSRLSLGGSGETASQAVAGSAGRSGAGAAAMPPGPVDPLSSSLTAQPVTPRMTLQSGDAVHIEQAGCWWLGKVLQAVGDDQFKVHYTGWGSQWDETVTRDRLRVARPTGMTITVHLDRGWALTGDLVDAKGDVITLKLTADNKLLTIFKQRIAYIESSDTGQTGIRR